MKMYLLDHEDHDDHCPVKAKYTLLILEIYS